MRYVTVKWFGKDLKTIFLYKKKKLKEDKQQTKKKTTMNKMKLLIRSKRKNQTL